MKNIKQLLMLFLFLLAGLGSVQAQGANDFSVSDSDYRWPAGFTTLRNRMIADGHYIFTLGEYKDLNRDFETRKYFVYSVKREDAMRDNFDGTAYVTFFDANQNFQNRVEMRPNDTETYLDGNSEVHFINQGGEAIGIVKGGSFAFLYEGPTVEPRSGRSSPTSTWSIAATMRIPRRMAQRIRYVYIDETPTGRVEREISSTEEQFGLEGQKFTTKQKEIPGYVISSVPDNATGYLSPYKKGFTYTRYPHATLKLVYTQLDDEGNMNIKVYNGTQLIKEFNAVPNQVGPPFEYWVDGVQYFHNQANPYIPRTDEVVYYYKRTIRKHISRVNPQLRMRVNN